MQTTKNKPPLLSTGEILFLLAMVIVVTFCITTLYREQQAQEASLLASQHAYCATAGAIPSLCHE